MAVAHEHSDDQGWPAEVWPGVGLIGLCTVLGFILFGEVDLEHYQGLLLPAIIVGLSVIFAVTYAIFSRDRARLRELQAKTRERLIDPVLDSNEHQKELREILEKLPD